MIWKTPGRISRDRGGPGFRDGPCVFHDLIHDPAQRERIVEIRDNLLARIAEAEREDWLGEVEGLQISLAGANDKIAQRSPATTVDLGMPRARVENPH